MTRRQQILNSSPAYRRECEYEAKVRSQAKMALAMRIWNATHADYRSDRTMASHPAVLVNDNGATVLQPLMLLNGEQLFALAKTRTASR